MTDLVLSFPVLYEKNELLYQDKLYVVNASELPESPIFHNSCSILCIGTAPGAYEDPRCEIVSVSQDVSLHSLFNSVQHIFAFFNDWEQKMFKAQSFDKPLSRIGDLAYIIFGNPILCLTTFNKALFLKYDSDRPETHDYYNAEPDEGEFMDEDEENLLSFTPGFSDTYLKKEPSLFPKGSFRYDHIYSNIYEGDQYLGRIIVDSAYKEFIDSDFTIIKWLTDYLKQILLQSSELLLGVSKHFELMMQQLLVKHMPFQNGYDLILTENNWERYNKYRCVFLKPLNNATLGTIVTNFALYLNEYFDSRYILLTETTITLIFNITKSKYSDQDQLQRLELLIQKYPYRAGVSTIFEDISDIWIYYQQAQQAFKIGEKIQPFNNFNHFDNCALQLMIENSLGNFGSEFYYTDSIKKLLFYDMENNTDLFNTIKVYLNNGLNATKALEELHICRSTFLYRINRVKDLTGIDLDNSNTRLYLLILSQIMNLP